MKNIALALTACALFSCQEPVNNTVIISGTITEPLSETVSVISSDRSKTFTDSLDNEAVFELEFQMDSPTYMSFKHGQETTAMYVKPGDVITININPAEFDETISYEGSKASSFLANKYLAEEQIDFRALYSSEETDFLAQVTEAESTTKALLNSLPEGMFKTEQVRSSELQWASTKLNYKKYYEYLGNGNLDLSANYYDFMIDFDVNDPALLENEESYNFLKTYISSNVSDEYELEILSNFNFIATAFTNQATKDKTSYDLLKDFIKNETLEEISLIMEAFEVLQSDSEKYNELNELVIADVCFITQENRPSTSLTLTKKEIVFP